MRKNVLQSLLAGQWYPADATQLRGQIRALLEGLDSAPLDDVVAVILPHAGYQYSGATALKALAGLKRRYHRIVVIGPSHRVPMQEVCSLPDVTHYETPLGQIPLDRPFLDALMAESEFENVAAAHQGEHSVQIEIPLLQYLFSKFRLVPIVVGQLSFATSVRVGRLLKQRLDPETLVVVSSDFTHYGPRFAFQPFLEDVEENLRSLDMGAYAHIESRDASGFLQYREETGATICGCVPIAILLSMLDPTHRCHLVDYTTSGRITGDYSNSVSYLSAQVSGHWSTPGKG